MKFFNVGLTVACTLVVCGTEIGLSQSPEQMQSDTVRVTVSMHPDGSRTIYKFDNAQHKAVATTTDRDGKLRETIHYELDEAGRFSSGEISGPDGRLRFKSRYKYDGAGRLLEETQSTEDGRLLHKIVYSYEASGKQTGYSVFDASGKLVGGNSATKIRPSSSPKAREKGSR
jgi:hypothetical protein